jgi:hypothetical protein
MFLTPHGFLNSFGSSQCVNSCLEIETPVSLVLCGDQARFAAKSQEVSEVCMTDVTAEAAKVRGNPISTRLGDNSVIFGRVLLHMRNVKNKKKRNIYVIYIMYV